METALTTIAGHALKMAITLSLLYIPYIFLLKRTTHFCTARTTLLATLLLSIALPFIDIPALHIEMPYTISTNLETANISVESGILKTAAIEAEKTNVEINPETLVYYTLVIPYIIVTLMILLMRTAEIIRIRANIRKGRLWIEEKERYTIHCHADDTPPYSWMSHVVISQKDYDLYGTDIILHEEGHIIGGHSWDILLLTLVESLQWFNPFVHMLAGDLKDIHEYEADAYVLSRREDTKAYQMLIIKKAVDRASYTLANSFNHSNNLKKRITMMLKKKSNPWRSATALYILPATALALSLFASPQEVTGTETNEPATVATDKVSEIAEINDTIKSQIFQVCEKVPEFPGGIKAMMEFLGKNVKYPIESREKGKEGRSIVTFVVNETGAISNVSIYKSSGDDLLDKEAIRVVSSMPKWTPGEQRGEAVKVRYTIPVAFRLTPETKEDIVRNIQISKDTRVFEVCEKMPEFPGGIYALMKYLRDNIKYPEESLKEKKEGKAYVSFVVMKDGSIVDIKIAKSSGDENLDKESLRVVTAMPKWIPGEQGGEAVNVRFTQPVSFRLQ